ncbi:hypothetical protein FQN57_004954 [Myotisia sp. PD_48]|nr:hypothetical protein FQN57_004954 [Myotisia sp. PD_48]
MATPAHCYYCFEALSASFEGSELPKLSAVEDLWAAFEASKKFTFQTADNENDIEDRETLTGGDGMHDHVESHVDASETDKYSQDGDTDDAEDGQRQRPLPQSLLQLPSVRRLQGGVTSSSTSSSGSSTSTPSALSTSSSRSALTGNTSVTSTSTSSPRSSAFFSSSRPSGEAISGIPARDLTYPLFVTWNTISRSGNKHLRGCIGTFEHQELAYGLKTYALTSAFGDTRYSPIPSSLLPALSCSLTLLSSFETCLNPLDWELGVHGIRISFVHRGKQFGATYLPDVAVEQGWTKDETLESLMRKAGWDGSSGVYGGVTRRFLRSSGSSGAGGAAKPWEEVSNFKTIRYQGLKSSATYAEWQEWREWVESSPSRLSLLEPCL